MSDCGDMNKTVWPASKETRKREGRELRRWREGGYKSKSTRSRAQYLIHPTHPPLPFPPHMHTVPAGAFPLFGSMTTSLPSIPTVFGGGRRQREGGGIRHMCPVAVAAVGRSGAISLDKTRSKWSLFPSGAEREGEGREPRAKWGRERQQWIGSLDLRISPLTAAG